MKKRKISKWFTSIALFSSISAIPIGVQASETVSCRMLHTFASTIMEARQVGVSRDRALDGLDSALYIQITEKAYDDFEKYKDKRMQMFITRLFAENVYEMCIKEGVRS